MLGQFSTCRGSPQAMRAQPIPTLRAHHAKPVPVGVPESSAAPSQAAGQCSLLTAHSSSHCLDTCCGGKHGPCAAKTCWQTSRGSPETPDQGSGQVTGTTHTKSLFLPPTCLLLAISLSGAAITASLPPHQRVLLAAHPLRVPPSAAALPFPPKPPRLPSSTRHKI